MKMIENRNTFVAAFASLALLLTSGCNPPCDTSDEENLGPINYSQEFQTWNLEAAASSLSFSRGSTQVVLNELPQTNNTAARLHVRKVCTTFDVKPYTAWAYYAYDNMDKIFSSNGYLINITAEIAGSDTNPSESIYINLSRDGQATIKGYIQVTNPQPPQPGNITPFQFNGTLLIDGRSFDNIWSYEKDGMGIYYNKVNGIIALKTLDGFYFRN